MRAAPRWLLAACLALVLPLAGCGGLPFGDDEDALVVYSGRNEKLIQPLFDRFTKATGIEIKARYGSTAELAAQLLEEGKRSPAEVFISQDAGALGALQQERLLAPLTAAQLDRVPASFRSADGDWVGTSGRVRVLVYNPTLVTPADLPKSVLDLASPRFKDKVAYAPTNASWQAFVTGLRVTQGEERTETYLRALVANGLKAYAGNAPIVDAVDAGQIPYGLVNHYYLAEKAAEAGGLAKVTARNHYFRGGDPGSLVNVAGVGVLREGSDPRAGQFVDFLLSEEGQRFFAEETKEYPLVAGIPTDPALPPLASLEPPAIDLARLAPLAETLRLLEKVGLS